MGPKPRVLLLSNSTMHGEKFLAYADDIIKDFFKGANVKKVLFFPYALKDMDEYADTAEGAFKRMGMELQSAHKCDCPREAAEKAEGFFIGGGNTFLLLKTLYEKEVVEAISRRVLNGEAPFMGSSAGTNVATVGINTTNDMPIVQPPSFKALGLVPFNINPHYLDPDPTSKHMGETRELRIKQYHEVPCTPPVLGMREGCILRWQDGKAELLGKLGARLFIRDKEPQELPSGADVTDLVNGTWKR